MRHWQKKQFQDLGSLFLMLYSIVFLSGNITRILGSSHLYFNVVEVETQTSPFTSLDQQSRMAVLKMPPCYPVIGQSMSRR